MRRHKFKYQHYTKSVKKERPSDEKMDLTGKPFEASDPKNNSKKDSQPCREKSWTQGFCKQQINISLQTVRIKLNKTWKKAFRSELLEFCKTGTKKSIPDMFSFYVILAGHDIVTDAGRATTCRRKCKALCLQTKV